MKPREIDIDSLNAADRKQHEDAERKLRKARAGIILDLPLLAGLLLKQEIVFSADLPTMATDGDHLYASPKFILDTPMDELKGVCGHEALHPGFCHHLRRGERDHHLWNMACDYAINPILVDHGLHLPDSALLSDEYRGNHAEAIYTKLKQKQQEQQEQGKGESGTGPSAPGGAPGDANGSPQPPDGGSGDSEAETGDSETQFEDFGGTGSVLDGDFDDASERQAAETEWKVAMAQSVAMAKAQGKLKGDLARLVDELVNPKADWREILRRFMDQFAKADYTWSRGNRRFIANGLYLPSQHSEQLGPIVFVVDASGSMPAESLTDALSELQSIFDELQPEYVDVVVHDTEVREHRRFYPGDDLRDLKVHAGGGTRFRPVVDWVNAQGEDYACAIWFTDLYADVDSAGDIESPLVWIDYAARGVAPEVGDEYVELVGD